MAESFKKLGIATKDCEGNKKKFRDVLEELADAYGIQLEPEPLIFIELNDEYSVPKVFYKGEEVEGKARIQFDWKTKRDCACTGGMSLNIEHFDKKSNSEHVIDRKNGEFLE